jgi:hypothetical protein
MKNILKAVLLSLTLISTASQAYEEIDLDYSRTSMEYSAQVRSFINNVENYKWESANGQGFHFVQAEKPYSSEYTDQSMFLTVENFFYEEEIGKSLMIVIQSTYVGFIDIRDMETDQTITARYLPNGTIQTINGGETMIFSKVSKRAVNPKPLPKDETSSGEGMIF